MPLAHYAHAIIVILMDPIVLLNKNFLLSLVNHNDELGTIDHSFTFLLRTRELAEILQPKYM